MRGLLATAGFAGGIFWIGIAFFPPQCVPVIEAYEVTCNRLWTPALVSMLLGFTGLFPARRADLTLAFRSSFTTLLCGSGLMSLGNLLEYWLFNDLPHQGPDGLIRGLAWMTVLAGFLVLHLAAAAVGACGLRYGYLSRWLSVLFLALIPATLLAGLISRQWIGIPLGMLSTAAGYGQLFPAVFHGQNTNKAIRANKN